MLRLAQSCCVALMIAGATTSQLWEPGNADAVGVVTRVIDGDTFVMGAVTIRLWGVAAPERKSVDSQIAREFLADLVLRKEAHCYKAGAPSYGRMVARCIVNGLEVNTMMIGSGLACEDEQYSRGAYAGARALRQRVPSDCGRAGKRAL